MIYIYAYITLSLNDNLTIRASDEFDTCIIFQNVQDKYLCAYIVMNAGEHWIFALLIPITSCPIVYLIDAIYYTFMVP